MAEGYTGGGPGGATSQFAGGTVGRRGDTAGGKPILEKQKSVGYSATQSDQILAIATGADAATKEAVPSRVEIENDGRVPIFIMAGYETYSSDTEDAGIEYLHTMLMPGDVYSPPVRGIIATDADTVIVDGTAPSNAEPADVMYEASGCLLDEGSNITNSVTNFTVDDGDYFRVGDLIRLDDEVMEVTSISTNELYVTREVHGSSKATHNNDVAIRLPFFNAYHDFDKYSVAQTDSDGKFKSMNFFGIGRTASAVQGLTPGSIALKFYRPGYQSLGLSGITSSTNSGLSASTTYYFTIRADGATAADSSTTTAEISFTTDSTNLNFGGSNGIIQKIQNALNSKFYDSTNTNVLFEKAVSVSIVNGDIRFTSGSHLSSSAIALTAGTSGSGASVRFFAQANGRIPALANVPNAVAARLPDDVTYDKVTYEAVPNRSAFVYDDGLGGLFGAATGSINYETGAIDFRNAPVNAEFVYSCIHTSAFSGKLEPDSSGDRTNTLVSVLANTPSQKWNGSVKVRTY